MSMFKLAAALLAGATPAFLRSVIRKSFVSSNSVNRASWTLSSNNSATSLASGIHSLMMSDITLIERSSSKTRVGERSSPSLLNLASKVINSASLKTLFNESIIISFLSLVTIQRIILCLITSS